ncbi:putative sulfate/molybdate transporter [Aliifodinibius sp. S!AR15-10]|uniref:putative sulfate/molybdate transporter n=1 Tax=Aliifodinibius sp. S!AR15-10 TaxID=2950437 RepID=UPI0028583952|nr:putative sulfate/molybdate transporter [Aliifodinibius sp. S!AR15-10]MDR8390740.1 putative sulfate/molybdate transporter [Aliifodinibius sp. S!AR15-10]
MPPVKKKKKEESLKNAFGRSEFAGAMGDLGTTIPLAFLLVTSVGSPAARIFFLWGLAYIAVGWYYKVPVSVQPLKAMTVIAVTTGLSSNLLSSTAVLYGLLFIVLAATGLITWLHRWFSKALIRGIQIGIGLLLAYKSWELISRHTLFLNGSGDIGYWTYLLAAAVLAILLFSFRRLNRTAALELIVVCIAISFLIGVSAVPAGGSGSAWQWTLPDWSPWWNIVALLVIPQLPLTLGNAVYAANDACHEFWPDRSEKVSITKLASTIGLINVVIGLFGGFPICHGAGGIAAHKRFSAQSGGAVIIIGALFVSIALSGSLSTVLFLIPIPVLGVLLLFDSWQMITFAFRQEQVNQIAVALTVGVLSFATHNLTIALLVGLLFEWGLNFWSVKLRLPDWIGRLYESGRSKMEL